MKLFERLKKFNWGYFLIAGIAAILGLCLFIFNNNSLDALAITIGILLILSAAFLAVLTIAAKNRGFSFGVKIALTIAMLVAGIVVLVERAATVNVMIGFFGLVMIIDGSFKFHTAAMSKRFELWSWIVILVLSVILIAGGYIVVRTLTIENSASVFVLGSLFIIDSAANFLSAFYISALDRRNEKQIREQYSRELNEKAKRAENARKKEQSET